MTVGIGLTVLAIVLVVYVGPVIFVTWLLWSALQRHQSSAPNEEG